jgi:hypothetical protein
VLQHELPRIFWMDDGVLSRENPFIDCTTWWRLLVLAWWWCLVLVASSILHHRTRRNVQPAPTMLLFSLILYLYLSVATSGSATAIIV